MSENRGPSREELERRKAELEYQAQMAALEGIELSKADRDEYLRIKKALEARSLADRRPR